MKPFTDWCKHVAVFFDDDGQFVGLKKLKYSETTFVFKDRTFNFLPFECSRFKTPKLISSTKYYQYNFNDPMPLIIKKQAIPLVNSQAYKNIIDTDIIKKINDLAKPNWLSMLFQPKVMVVVILIAVAIWYFSKGSVA